MSGWFATTRPNGPMPGRSCARPSRASPRYALGRNSFARPSTTARCHTGCSTASRPTPPSCGTSEWCSALRTVTPMAGKARTAAASPPARTSGDMSSPSRACSPRWNRTCAGLISRISSVRTEASSPPRPTGEQPFADGHASCILKAYREALNHPDDAFFKEYWPHVNRAVEYLIGRDAKAAGGEPAGVLQDDQWNTYDEALHGVTTFISGYYLAALRAGEEWGRRVGDGAVADRFRGVFEKGQKRLVELCWNGEYFQQHLPDYMKRHGEVGPGCMADQLLGQWWAHQLGLGYVLPKEMVVSAMRAVFKYNFKTDLTGWQHAPRAFAGVKDKGLIVCTWPKGGRPNNVMLYSDELWTGIEYQAAAHLIYEGMVEEGFAIVKAARDDH